MTQVALGGMIMTAVALGQASLGLGVFRIEVVLAVVNHGWRGCGRFKEYSYGFRTI